VSAFADVDQFVKSANRASRMQDLALLLTDVVAALGFDYVALLHHVSTPEQSRWKGQVVNYPEEWRAQIRAQRYLSEDPVLTVSQRSAAAFLWSELPALFTMSPRQKQILENAFACGLSEGFTVPLNIPGEFTGSCSFGLRPGRDAERAALPAAQYVGCFAFEAARRIQAGEQTCGLREPAARPLSQRQYDCVVLVAQGKSDWDIAQLLGIASDTVHQHIEAAKHRYGVASRTQLVVRALFDSQITFADIIR
jgi:LuxR family quorum-sensing system transcriptional regulator CciR